jgi:hypothetical protein
LPLKDSPDGAGSYRTMAYATRFRIAPLQIDTATAFLNSKRGCTIDPPRKTPILRQSTTDFNALRGGLLSLVILTEKDLFDRQFYVALQTGESAARWSSRKGMRPARGEEPAARNPGLGG